jgi:homoserine kinase type II
MAVYTHVGEAELAAFLDGYDLGEAHSLAGIAQGIENSNYFLQTARGAFVLTLYERRVREADLPFFLGLMQHLARAGIACPRPVPRRDGALYSPLCGKPAAIVSRLPGGSVTQPQPAHCRQAGAALAAMHLAAPSFALRRENALSLHACLPFAETLRTRADGFRTGLGGFLAGEARELASAWPIDLPRGIVHADLFPDNVFFEDDRLCGLIDFYFAASDFLAWDLAVCLNAWCFSPDGSFLPQNAAALFAGYEALRPLLSAERAAMPLLARGAALRFALTRLHDRLEERPGALVIPRDPGEYVDRLHFHRNIREPSRYFGETLREAAGA